MNLKPENLSWEELGRLLSSGEFHSWTEGNPERCDQVIQLLESQLKNGNAKWTPQLRAEAERNIVWLKQTRGLAIFQQKIIEVKKLFAAHSRPQPDVVKAIMDEMTDALLESPEPYRTEYLKELVPLRERLGAVENNGQ